jgi:hypothetical protein
VSLRKFLVTVTVAVTGSGHVTSSPAGIQCGTGYDNQPLTDCSHDFGPGVIKLYPHGNDPDHVTFTGWSGDCPANVQECDLTPDGSAPVSATAHF